MLIYFLLLGFIWNLLQCAQRTALKWQKENRREPGRERWPGKNLKTPHLIWALLSWPLRGNKWKLVSPMLCSYTSPTWAKSFYTLKKDTCIVRAPPPHTHTVPGCHVNNRYGFLTRLPRGWQIFLCAAPSCSVDAKDRVFCLAPESRTNKSWFCRRTNHELFNCCQGNKPAMCISRKKKKCCRTCQHAYR